MVLPRRKFVKYFGLSFLGGKLPWPGGDADSETRFLRNENLETLVNGYKGNPFANGRFMNAGMANTDKSFGQVLGWFLSPNPQKEEKEKENYQIPVHPLDQTSVTQDCIIWLGHASFLIRLNGKWILTDPCLTAPPFQKRFTALPLPIEKIRADYILISHGHYDHLDSESMEKLNGQGTTVLAPLRMKKLLEKMNSDVHIQEAGWYQVYQIDESFKISFLPAQHWYLRVPWDRNKILWGSFMIETPEKKIYFAGDTGYAPHFSELGKLFPGIDYALMPIGAYKPPGIMRGNHTDPEEAVRAFNELGAKTFIPMHFGTFDLADEPRGEPIRWLKELNEQGKLDGQLKLPDLGEPVLI
ncbi:MAG: MBL fold metallo-hydrolase [Bacteroidetes bacterium]|nr:MBL fold metallo-hydrolase [Bacteroidota bacterium]